MRYKIIAFLFIFIFGVYNQNIRAQALNINGDTIFVSTEAEIRLIFPTLPTNFKTVPAATNFRIWNSPTGINLMAESENYDPVTLLVSEAQRSHRFILVFKKNTHTTEMKFFYDYSTEKKLAQHISETAFSNSQTAFINNDANNPGKNKEIAVAGPVDTSSNYYALLEQGDKNLMLKNYQGAKLSFDKAHSLRPYDIVPVQRLEMIKIKLAEIEKSEQKEGDKKYLLLTEEAKNKIDQKKYLDAKNIYLMVLNFKPGDAYVTQQLQIVSNLLAGETAQAKKQKTNDVNGESAAKAQRELSDSLSAKNNYDSAVESADNFFDAGDYESARREYNNALRFSSNDWPKLQLNKITKIVNEQRVRASDEEMKLEEQQEISSEPKADGILTLAEIKKKYNLVVAMGKSSYLKNDLLNAKTFYEEAMNLQPSQQLPKNQLKIINNKLEELAREAALNENYYRAIALADSLVIAKAYDSAITSYKRASFLRPLESYPWKQLKYIQSELALNEKRKKEEQEQQYNYAITRADKAVTDKKYDDAKSAYQEALSIHPDNEYVKRRLEIISYQLEKARIDKLTQDSLKVVVPVKKSKRKRSK